MTRYRIKYTEDFGPALLADSIDMDVHPVHAASLADAAHRARPAIRDYIAYVDCGTAEERARHNAAIGHNPRSTYVYDPGTAY